MAKVRDRHSPPKHIYTRPASVRPAPINLDAIDPEYHPRDVQGGESIDIGSVENIPRSASTRHIARDAGPARMRATMVAPTARPRERAIPASELETHGPVPFTPGRLPLDSARFLHAASDQQGPLVSIPTPAGRARMLDQRIAELEGKPANTVSTSTAGIAVRELTVEDVDLLWDWIRQEEDRAFSFFGEHIKSALDLHLRMRGYLEAEAQGTAKVRAVEYQGETVGVTAAYPINVTDRLALVHIFLCQKARPLLALIVPTLLSIAENELPEGVRVAVYANRPGWVDFLAPHKFRAHTLLIRERNNNG